MKTGGRLMALAPIRAFSRAEMKLIYLETAKFGSKPGGTAAARMAVPAKSPVPVDATDFHCFFIDP